MKFLSDILAKAGLTVDGVVTLNNTATGQTPDANDNSTKLATTAWVRTFVQPYSLPIASSSVLGGIKVGNGLSIDAATGVLSTVGGGGSITSFRSEYIITATAGQTTFTVPGGYTPNKIDLFLNGVYLNDYTYTATDSSTVILNDGALLDDKLTIFVYSTYYVGDSPSARTTTYFTATNNQTTFTVDYVLGQVDIFYNGSKLEPEEYTANNGTSIILTTPCNAGDKIEVVNWATGGGIANTRTLTINGITYDLSANRTWTLTTSNIGEGTNLYYTDTRARAAISLTTNGSSGIATYIAGVLNIPNYQGLVPAGGATGQILSKVDGTDYNTQWLNEAPASSYTSQLKHVVKSSQAITKGQAVYVSSADGTNMIVSKASNATEGTSSKTMGLLESTVSTNGFANVITEGLLAGLDTTGANAAGDPVWLGTDGNLIYGLLNKPSAPAHLVFIGVVTRRNANNGEIFVKVQNGFEMGELHDYVQNGVQDNYVISYELSTSLYKPKSIPTLLGYTPANAARSLTINGTSYDLTTDRTWTLTSSNITEGTNLYYTDTRVGTYLTANSYATQSYVSTQINNLVSGAPGLLDTLDELAAALGDDPNFATTVSTALSNRLRIDIGTQGLTSTQQGYGRTNLGLGSLATLSSIGNSYITDLAYSKLTGVPSTFAPSAHTHVWTDITDRPTNLSAFTNGPGYITGYTETDTLSSVTARGASTSTTLNLDGRVNIGNGLTRPSALNSDSVAHARIGGSDVHLYVASLGAAGSYKVAVQAARYSDFASFSLDLQSNGGTLLYGGNEVATRTWVTSQSYLTGITSSQVTTALGYTPYNSSNPSGYISSYTETDTLASVTGRGASTTAGINVNGRLTAAGAGTYAVTGSSTQRYIMQALNTSNSVNAAYGWWWYHNTNGDMGFHADAVGDILNITRGGGVTVNGNTILTAGNYSSYALPLTVTGTQTLRFDTASTEHITFQNQSSGGLIQLGFQQTDSDGLHHRAYIKAYKSTAGNYSGVIEIIARSVGGGTTVDVLKLEAGQAPKWGGSIMLHAGNYSSYALPTGGGTMTGQITWSSGVAPISFQQGGNNGTYTQTTIYANQNNTSGDTANGIFIERGYTNTSNTEIRHFVIGVRGGGIQWKLDGPGNTTQSGSVSATSAILTSDGASRALYLKGSGNIIQFQDASANNKWEVVGRDGTFYIYKNDGGGIGYRWQINSSGNHTINGSINTDSAISAGGKISTGSGGFSLSGNSGFYTSYTSDGLFSTSALPNILGTVSNGGSMYLGYQDNGSGLYSPAYGFDVRSTDGRPVAGIVVKAIVMRDLNTGAQPFIVYNNGAIYSADNIQASKYYVNGDSWIVFNNEEGAWGIKTRTTTNTGNLGGQLKNIIYCGGGVNEGFAVIGSGTGNASFEVKNDGTAWIKGSLTAGGDVTAFSDARIKTNIVTITSALNKTLALRGVFYNRTDIDDTRTKIGVIAQEVNEVLPEVVYEQPTGMLGVSYGNMAGLFIEAIKELKAENDALKEILKRNNII
jgi:hypothetical protein